MIESVLLAVTRISTLFGKQTLSNATGFFFERGERLFLVTARHVLLDEASGHQPDGIEIELHTDPADAAKITRFYVPLYEEGVPAWRQGTDGTGLVDMATLELQRAALPESLAIRAFSPDDLVKNLNQVEVGTSVLIVGFPLGFHDTLHHLPVARQAIVASAFGIRFQGAGYFLTDARLHRGTSGAPVVVRSSARRGGRQGFPWKLLGVHTTQLDLSDRDANEDGRLQLNCTWYADMLLVLTE